MRRLIVLLLGGVALIGGGCGAHRGGALPLVAEASARPLPSLPKAEAPQAANRTASAYTFGEADVLAIQGGAMSLSQLTLGPTGLSYAVLGVNTWGLCPPWISVTGTLSGLWVAVSDYSRGSWSWLGDAHNAPTVLNLPPSGTVSPGGSIYIALVCPAGSSASVTVEVELPKVAEWNLLVWLAADNDLASAAVDNLNEMESVGSTDNVQVLAGYDIDPSVAQGVQGIDKVHFIKVVQDSDLNSINTTGDPSDMDFARAGYNSADPANLVAFLEWAGEHFPAKHQALVLWDHGDGWLPGWKGTSGAGGHKPSGVLGDDSDGDWLLTDNLVIAQALAGRHFDILGFDACNMAHLEALYDYRDLADWIAASEALMPNHGYPYAAILGAWNAATTPDAESVARIIADETSSYYDGQEYVCQAAINAADLSGLAGSLKSLATAVTANAATESPLVKQSIGVATEPDGGDGERDLTRFLSAYRASTADTTIQGLLDDALAKCGGAIDHYAQYGLPDTTGISAFLPNVYYFDQTYQDDYAPLTFNQDTGWLDMLKATGVPGRTPYEADWGVGERIEITWSDPDCNVDLYVEDPQGNSGGPWFPDDLGMSIEFSVDNPDGGGLFEWARLKSTAYTGDYIIGAEWFDYNGSTPPPFVEVAFKLYDSSDQLKQDFGSCKITYWGYKDYVTLHYTP